MKILLLTHRLPYPLEWGQHLRLFHLARQLARHHELHLVAFGAPPYASALEDVFRTIRTLPIPSGARTPRTITAFLKELAADEMVVHDPAMARLVEETLSREGPDVVWVGGYDMLVYVPRHIRVRVVADVIDESVLEHFRALKHAPGSRTMLRHLQLLVRCARWERRFFRRGHCCVFVSAVDARWARRVVPGLRVAVVENGVDVGFFKPLAGEEDFPSVAFEGNQSFPPNVDAAAYFVRAIFPAVLERFPACRFSVVGRDPAPSIRALATEQIVVTGRVDDIRPYLDQASVVVCPMRTGAGIKNKLLQALAMGKAIVATQVALGGLHVLPGRDLLVADDPRSFAAAVIDLLADDMRRRDLGKQARDAALAHYTWEQQAQAFEGVLRSA
jgi:sugar transferase (PEP-CTERM/EpsH1 system associated)